MKKRIFSFLLASALCASLAIPALAVNDIKVSVTEDGKLSITGSSDLNEGDIKWVTIVANDEGQEDEDFVAFVPIVVGSNGEIDYTYNGVINTDKIHSVSIPDVGDYTQEKESEPDVTSEPEDSDSEDSKTEDSSEETSHPEDSSAETSNPEDSEPESRPEPGRPVNPDTPSGGSTSDDDDDSSGGGGGGGSSISTNPNPIKYKGKTEKQTPTQITTPNTGWTSNAGSQMVFFDVQTTDWFANAVNYVTQNGMMVGSNNRFSPNDRLTRGMMAQILYNIEGNPATGTANFPDVNSSDWFANAVAWASANGCMSGYANGRFGPNDPITREQLAAILYRYSGMKGYTTAATAELTGFVDGNATSGWAQTSMRWAVTTGLLSGKTGNRLDPTGTATRAEVAQILMNFGTKIAQ